ncbi:MAG: glycosyltransferase family 39 protein [Solobacterium sp.]|jgi:hypothetical protein|nr:glycosyltransferase family 39 protein [Solobacterium sp.]
MKTAEGQAAFLQKAGDWMLLMLVIAGILVKEQLGFDIDEQYAFSMMYRFSEGQRYLADLFDPHQFSALLMTPLFLLCRTLSIQYTVLLFRLFSAVIYAVGSIPIYRFVRKETGDQKIAMLSALFFFTLTPKSIISLEHSNLSNLFLIYVLIDLYRYLKYHELHVIHFAAESVLLGVCYPTLVFLVVPVVILMVWKKDGRLILQYLGLCLIGALIFLIPALIYQKGFAGVLSGVSMVLLEGSHQFSLKERMLSLLSDSYFFAKYLCAYLLVSGAMLLWRKLVHRSVLCSVPDVMIFCMSPFITGIIQVLLTTAAPCAGYTRYLLLLLVLLILSVKRKEAGMKRISLFLLLVVALMYLTSNNGLFGPAGFCAFAGIGLILLFRDQTKGSSLLLCAAIVCQCSYYLLSYHVTGGGPESVFHFDLVSGTVVKGIYTEPADDQFFRECAQIETVSESGKVMLGGSDSYAYLAMNADVFAPTTISTPNYSSQWREYLDLKQAENFDLILETSYEKSSDLLKVVSEDYTVSLAETGETYTHYLAVRK